MLEKLLLAVTITFSLNLFLGDSLPNTSTTASSYHPAETPTLLVRRLYAHGFLPVERQVQRASRPYKNNASLPINVSQ